MELLLAARLTGVPVRQHDYPCSVAIYHLYMPGPSPTASNFATVSSLLSAALRRGLRRNETLVSVYLSNAVWPEIVSSADNDLPRFPSALLDGRCTTAVSTGLGGRTLALRLPPRDAFPLTKPSV